MAQKQISDLAFASGITKDDEFVLRKVSDGTDYRITREESRSDLSSTAQGQGSSLVGDSSGATVHDLLPIHLQFSTYADLRAYSHISGVDIVQITGDGIAGNFKADPSDTTSTDDGRKIIVAADGTRWKRQNADEVVQVADYAALRSYVAANGRDTVFVINPGIAGEFNIDLSDTTTADDGGTVIVATDGTRWKRQIQQELRLEWFGFAAANTGAQNKTAIQAAITAGATLGIYTIIARQDQFTVAGGISWPGCMTLQGAGYTQFNVAGNTTYLFHVVKSSVVNSAFISTFQAYNQGHFADFIIYGGNTSGYGVLFGDTNTTADNSAAMFSLTRVGFNYLTVAEKYQNNVWIIRHKDCLTSYCDTGVLYVGNVNGGENIVYTDGSIINCKTQAIRMAGSASMDLYFKGISFDYNNLLLSAAKPLQVSFDQCHIEYDSITQISQGALADKSTSLMRFTDCNIIYQGTNASSKFMYYAWKTASVIFNGTKYARYSDGSNVNINVTKAVTIPTTASSVTVSNLPMASRHSAPRVVPVSALTQPFNLGFQEDGRAPTTYEMTINLPAAPSSAQTFMVYI